MDVPKIDFRQIKMIDEVEYNDGDIAFISDIREVPIEARPVSVEMFMIIISEQGRFQIDINDTTHAISEKTLLLCKPQEILGNCMISPDFIGKILCISNRVLVDSFSDSDFWDRGINILNRRSIPIDESSVRMYNLYGELFKAKMSQSKPLFMREIIHSLVKAAIYELLSCFDGETNEYGRGLVKQREILFQRFINLLSGLRVKPRSVAEYAERLCVSPKHLASVCKQVSGKTAYEWINEYVRNDINNLLRNSNKSIKEIANFLEFPSLSFFGKYIKAYSGLSPTEYRRKLREQETEQDLR